MSIFCNMRVQKSYFELLIENLNKRWLEKYLNKMPKYGKKNSEFINPCLLKIGQGVTFNNSLKNVSFQ